MIIVTESAAALKGFLAKTELNELGRMMLLRVVLAFIMHRGRMSCSAAAGSVASEPVPDDVKILMTNAVDLSVREVIELYSLRWHTELLFKELKSTLGFSQYSFQSFRAVKAWVEMAITTVLFLEFERIKHVQDRRLSQETRRWWEMQRLHGLCHAYRQQCAGAELKYLSDRLKTPGGIAKLRRMLNPVVK